MGDKVSLFYKKKSNQGTMNLTWNYLFIVERQLVYTIFQLSLVFVKKPVIKNCLFCTKRHFLQPTMLFLNISLLSDYKWFFYFSLHFRYIFSRNLCGVCLSTFILVDLEAVYCSFASPSVSGSLNVGLG